MSTLFLKAVGLTDKTLPNSVLSSLQNVTTTSVELDGGYLLVDHYGEKGVRKSMEDECLVCDSLKALCPQLPSEYDFAVFGLFDGHGGRQSAVFAKQNLLGEVASQLVAHLNLKKESGDQEDFEVTFKKSVNSACRRLDTRIANEVQGCADGSTALLLFFGKKTAYILNLGDSAAYLCKKVDSVLHSIPLNDIHKPWSQKEKARILHYGGTIEGGRVNGLLEVTRSFGDLQLKKYGVLCVGSFRKFELDFKKDELIVLACDGFWGLFDASDACRKSLDFVVKEEMRASTSPHLPFPQLKKVCKELVDVALNVKRSQDNVSVMLVRFKSK
ncbi:protein phosphatase 2c [Theileria orientalis]|uniref:protein-serine/threonine phosphatase n=1 Tax=Theileria orientalis TaxID=68886 RepID=A0A976QRD8_THEOR|nr:protein phosphatase 2c [Theileria orientalis]